MTHLLDTNICIYLIKNRPESLVQRLQSKEIEQIGISTITLSELEYGVAKSQQFEKNSVALIEFLTPFKILDFNQTAAHEYGFIRTFLEEKGQLIGPMDLLIAAHAIAEGLILVTNNEREFRRVPALKVENWVAE
jgi:tRNA(fMet)-specific endonuclease VapC